jgi:hypothetical protein
MVFLNRNFERRSTRPLEMQLKAGIRDYFRVGHHRFWRSSKGLRNSRECQPSNKSLRNQAHSCRHLSTWLTKGTSLGSNASFERRIVSIGSAVWSVASAKEHEKYVKSQLFHWDVMQGALFLCDSTRLLLGGFNTRRQPRSLMLECTWPQTTRQALSCRHAITFVDCTTGFYRLSNAGLRRFCEFVWRT